MFVLEPRSITGNFSFNLPAIPDFFISNYRFRTEPLKNQKPDGERYDGVDARESTKHDI